MGEQQRRASPLPFPGHLVFIFSYPLPQTETLFRVEYARHIRHIRTRKGRYTRCSYGGPLSKRDFFGRHSESVQDVFDSLAESMFGYDDCG